SNSWKHRSSSGGPLLAGPRPRRRYWCRASTSSTVARVRGDTSGRPLSTFDTVGTETPASAAMTAIVVRPLGWLAILLSLPCPTTPTTPQLSSTVAPCDALTWPPAALDTPTPGTGANRTATFGA